MIEGLYKVTCSLLLENDEVCDFEYYGPLAFYNRTLDGNMSNLTDDVELTFTQGMAIYYGDIYEMGSDAWNVVLAEADYDLDINYGQGDAVQLAFNVTHGARRLHPRRDLYASRRQYRRGTACGNDDRRHLRRLLRRLLGLLVLFGAEPGRSAARFGNGRREPRGRYLHAGTQTQRRCGAAT